MSSKKEQESYAGPERRNRPTPVEVVPVRLTRKYAESINKIDLSERRVGDRLPLALEAAVTLIGEGWAEPVPAAQCRTYSTTVEIKKK